MKQIHLPSPAAGPHQPCRPIDGCWLIVSGGTATAASTLISKDGAECVEACFIMGLSFLEGIRKLEENTAVYSVIEVD